MYLNSVFEFHSSVHFVQFPESAQPLPSAFGTLPQLEHHAQHGGSGQTALGTPGAVPDRRKR